MKYTPSDQPAKSFFVPAGDYPVTIVEASETVSRSSGADMIKLTLEVEAPDGSPVKLFDYLVATPSSAWKIDAFRRALGQTIVKGEAVELAAEDLIGRSLRARLKVEEFEGKQNNKVDAWLAPLSGAAPAAAAAPQRVGVVAAAPAANTDEDVPF